ncbi:MAG TPA: OsmC family protein [Anaerolineales bacterium]
MSGEWKEVVADWHSESAFIGHNAAGGSVQIGTIDDRPGVGPMEMLLLGLAGCTGMDIVSILGKKRQTPQKFQVRVRGLKANDYPKIYTDIEVTYLIWGEGIEPQAVEAAIELSEKKYCSVGIMLEAAAKIHSSYQILTPDEAVKA